MSRLRLESPILSMAVLLLASSLSSIALAQYEPLPEIYLPKALSAEAMSRLCGADNQVDARQLVGELSAVASINILALPRPPRLESGDIASTPEATMAAWIVASITLDPEKVEPMGMSKDYFDKLDEIRFEFGDVLAEMAANPKPKLYTLTSDSALGPEPIKNSNRVAESVLADALGVGRVAGIRLACLKDDSHDSKSSKESSTTSRISVVVRGKIDDLATPHFAPDSTEEVSTSYGKASEAKVGFSENGVKGERAVNIEIAVAAGRQVTANDEFLGFLHFIQNSTETSTVGDDDDSKDVRALSPGILYRHSIGGQDATFFGTIGATLFPTYDFAQDSRIARARFFYSDIAISTPHGPLCGRQAQVGGPLYYSCRLGLFGEIGKVVEAGRSADLATIEDDEYSGIGGSVGLSFWLSNPKALAPLSLNMDYRYMRVVSGSLSNPKRFMVELSYMIPKSNLSISLSRTHGENSETFQKEDVNKLSIGYKY